MTQTIALIGHPVAHSISPAFQQAALDALGVDARYEAWDLLEADLPVAAERLRSAQLLGANVTVPHKQAMLRFVDRPDALVERVGALNTIVRRDSLLHATNTDVSGLLAALRAADADPRGLRVLVVGAGGAARAAVVAMRSARAASVVVANRTLARAEALTNLGGTELTVTAVPLDVGAPAFVAAMAAADLVLQSTTIGMRHGPDEGGTPVPASLFHRGQVAFDLVYVPERTPFLAAAEAGGARPIGGLGMLVHQGAEAFRLWTGFDPPIEVMSQAARAALAAREA
ncbi:MAG: shikimate dehydrogenase [Dehalococcoidia bacterium]